MSQDSPKLNMSSHTKPCSVFSSLPNNRNGTPGLWQLPPRVPLGLSQGAVLLRLTVHREPFPSGSQKAGSLENSRCSKKHSCARREARRRISPQSSTSPVCSRCSLKSEDSSQGDPSNLQAFKPIMKELETAQHLSRWWEFRALVLS